MVTRTVLPTSDLSIRQPPYRGGPYGPKPSPRAVSGGPQNQRMAHNPTAAGESATLAASLRAYLSETGFAFTDVTATETTPAITRAVANWAKASGWKCRLEAPMRYIQPPRLRPGGCRTYWSPPWSAYLDLRLLREDGPPFAVEIDRADTGTAVDKLRYQALRGAPRCGSAGTERCAPNARPGVARLHLPKRATRSPIRYTLAPVDEAALTYGEPVPPKARSDPGMRYPTTLTGQTGRRPKMHHDCRLKDEGVPHAMLGIARLHNLPGHRTSSRPATCVVGPFTSVGRARSTWICVVSADAALARCLWWVRSGSR